MRRSTTDDVVALGQLNAAYADVITRRAFNELGELLLPDCVVHLDLVSAPARDLVGPEALAGMLRSALERFDHFMLVIRNSVVEADVDECGVVERATGRMFISEIRHDRSTGAWEETHGMYEDDYLRVDGRWWFAERHYRSLARNANGAVVLGLPERFRHASRPGR
ncbi:MAG: nuclear transport factor 2 family protein [Candidatus Microthrix sp.]|nr:nuclear transport factor 2 family protein [Candidatus Microthrix sp.]MBK7321903.1 nuclear transport factor 2 family protein [Candidatus Microthrix sp.]